MALSNKQKVIALLNSIESKDAGAAQYINPENYIQHNLFVEDGLAGVGKLFELLPPETKVDVIRIFEDGPYVFAHVNYNFFGPKVGFDIFRFEDQMIVEHWDNLQQTQPLNPSRHSMIDGAIIIEDREATEANKKLAEGIVTDILVNGEMEKLAGYYDGDNYIQHNPWFPDKVSGLIQALTEWAQKGKVMKYDKIHKVLGEGNFSLVVSEGWLDEKHAAFYDLFRTENGKIAEHWDVIEEILPTAKHKNKNGKFGFS